MLGRQIALYRAKQTQQKRVVLEGMDREGFVDGDGNGDGEKGTSTSFHFLGDGVVAGQVDCGVAFADDGRNRFSRSLHPCSNLSSFDLPPLVPRCQSRWCYDGMRGGFS